MVICSCDIGFGNTGKSNCLKSFLVTTYLLLQSLVGSNATANSFDVSAGEPSAADITSALNAADRNDRLYPVGQLEEINDERADSIFQEFASGKKAFVRPGFRDFVGFWPNVEPVMAGKLGAARCQEMGAYMIDAGSNFIFSARKAEGIVDTAFPVKIDSDTYDVKYVKATDSTISGVMIKFQWHADELDSYLRMVSGADLDWGPSILRGLIDVNSVATPSGSVTASVQLVDDYGLPVEGLVAGDMALANLTTPGVVAIDSVTETVPGTYLIDYTTAALAAAQTLELTITKNAYDFYKVTENTWVTL